jgi:hypothetical protein
VGGWAKDPERDPVVTQYVRRAVLKVKQETVNKKRDNELHPKDGPLIARGREGAVGGGVGKCPSRSNVHR